MGLCVQSQHILLVTLDWFEPGIALNRVPELPDLRRVGLHVGEVLVDTYVTVLLVRTTESVRPPRDITFKDRLL